MTTEVTAPAAGRVTAFDRLRGLIIVLMALDHASYFIARVHPIESWATPPPYYAGAVAFFTRWITHLCAPGFFMLMGAGVVYFAHARIQAGWAASRVTQFLITRGFMLLIVQQFVENPAWLMGILSVDPAAEAGLMSVPGRGDAAPGPAFAVLSALGVSMMAASVLWRLPPLGLAFVIVSSSIFGIWHVPPAHVSPDTLPVWRVLLHTPARIDFVQNLYPWLVWMFPTIVGIGLGRMFLDRRPRPVQALASLGAFMLGAFVVLRLIGGDPHAPQSGMIGFLTVTKYPPSQAFFALTLGADLLILAAFLRWPVQALTSLEVFGRAPFFFYLAHLWIFGVLSWGFRTGASWPVTYALWIAVVVALYPLCARYSRFKSARPPESIWRML